MLLSTIFFLATYSFTTLEKSQALADANVYDMLYAVHDIVGMEKAREMILASSFMINQPCSDPDHLLPGDSNMQSVLHALLASIHEDKFAKNSPTLTDALRANDQEVLLEELNNRVSNEDRLELIQECARFVDLDCGGVSSYVDRRLSMEQRIGEERRRKCYAQASAVFVENPEKRGDLTAAVPTEMWKVSTGQRVLSRDPENGQLFFDEIWLSTPNYRYRPANKRTCSGMHVITYESDEEPLELHVTNLHSLLTRSGSFKPVHEFVAGDEIHTTQGWSRVISNEPLPQEDHLISHLYTTQGQYLVGAPGQTNFTRAALGSNLAVLGMAKIITEWSLFGEEPFASKYFRWLRNLAGPSQTWHFHEYVIDWFGYYMPKVYGVRDVLLTSAMFLGLLPILAGYTIVLLLTNVKVLSAGALGAALYYEVVKRE